MVTVSREGNFTRSGLGEIDEAEIFEGAENRLTMNQTYTREFQCQYELQRYPFDTQVPLKSYGVVFLLSQECKIKMTVMDLAMKTVELVDGKVAVVSNKSL